jgi:Tfp pilus assembly protein PilW
MKAGMRLRGRSRGFSLIELMIGVVISMMGLAAVSVMMMNFSKKRTSITETLVRPGQRRHGALPPGA